MNEDFNDLVTYYDQSSNVKYYLPNLFKYNKLYLITSKDYENKNNDNNEEDSTGIQLLLRDLTKIWFKSIQICSLYYTNVIPLQNQLFMNNNPFNSFVVSGNIYSTKYKTSNYNKNHNVDYDFILFKIDDNSSINNMKENVTNPFQFYLPRLKLPNGIKSFNQIFNIKVIINKIDFKLNYLFVDSILAFNFNLTLQINHWKQAISKRRIYENLIWDLNNANSVRNNTSGSTESLLSSSSPALPAPIKPSRNDLPNYIENLQYDFENEKLEITSPYLTPIHLTNEETSSIASQPIPSLNLSAEHDQFRSRKIVSEKNLKLIFIDSLIDLFSSNNNNMSILISIDQLYNHSYLHNCLNSFCNHKFQNQNLLTLNYQSINQTKLETFTSIMKDYLQDHLKLIHIVNNNSMIDMTTLMKLYNYSFQKINYWCKLKTSMGVINNRKIAKAVQENINNYTIILIFKTTLQRASQTGQCVGINNWYFEIENSDISIVHLFYHDHS